MAELKPCPFCGCKAMVDKHSFYNDRDKAFTDFTYGVMCMVCGAKGSQFYTDEERAIEAWNRRVNNA